MHNVKFFPISELHFFINHRRWSNFVILRRMSSRASKAECNYQILDLTPSASQKQIKQAYYNKSKIYHPDLNKSADAVVKFHKLNLAYEILSNEQSRQEYDIDRGYTSRLRQTPTGSVPEESYGDPLEIQLNRKIYNRMKRSSPRNPDDYRSENFDAGAPRPFWQKVRSEEEFYDNLSEDMKKSYQEYLHNVRETKQMNENEFKQTESNLGLFPAFLCIIVILGVLEFYGKMTAFHQSNERKPPS